MVSGHVLVNEKYERVSKQYKAWIKRYFAKQNLRFAMQIYYCVEICAKQFPAVMDVKKHIAFPVTG